MKSDRIGTVSRVLKIVEPFRRLPAPLHCLEFQVPRGPFGIGPAANMMRVREYVRYRRDRDTKRSAMKGREREREEGDDLTPKDPVECRIISGLHTFRVSAHYTQETHSALYSLSPFFLSLSQVKCARPREYLSLPEKMPEGHKRRTIEPEVERARSGTERGGRGKRERERGGRSSRISIANHNILLLTCRSLSVRNTLLLLSIKLSTMSRARATEKAHRCREKFEGPSFFSRQKLTAKGATERIAKDVRMGHGGTVVCRRSVRPVWLPIVHSDRQKTRRTNARNNFVNALPLFRHTVLFLLLLLLHAFSLSRLRIAPASFHFPHSFVNARNVIFLPAVKRELFPFFSFSFFLYCATFGSKDNEPQEIIFCRW